MELTTEKAERDKNTSKQRLKGPMCRIEWPVSPSPARTTIKVQYPKTLCRVGAQFVRFELL